MCIEQTIDALEGTPSCIAYRVGIVYIGIEGIPVSGSLLGNVIPPKPRGGGDIPLGCLYLSHGGKGKIRAIEHHTGIGNHLVPLLKMGIYFGQVGRGDRFIYIGFGFSNYIAGIIYYRKSAKSCSYTAATVARGSLASVGRSTKGTPKSFSCPL